MANILIVSQKELIAAPIFKQDQNVLELYSSLKDTNNVEVLFLHKDMNLSDKKETKKVDVKQENTAQQELVSNAKQFCIRDMMKKRLFKINLNNFIKEHKVETIIFMSNYMAKMIIPYIENLLGSLNVICDLRLTNMSSFLQQYQNEKEKDDPNFKLLYKNFKIHFIQLLPILQYTDSIILDEDYDTCLLNNQKINNIISPKQVKDYIKTKNKTEDKTYKIVEIIVNRNNYYSNINTEYKNNVKIDTNKYFINETKSFNLIDDINNIIKNDKSDYIVIHTNKIELLPNTLELLAKNMSFNDNLALAAPNVFYSREKNKLKTYFETQKVNNFSNWNEDKPLSFSECVIIKKKFFNKVGLFDNKFKTFDYALFDFILKLYQIKAYYCVMNDVSVFKPMNVLRQISLFKEDKKCLCRKWGESLFNMGI